MADADQHRVNPCLIEFSLWALKLQSAEISVVQIGANDGHHGDPLNPHIKNKNRFLSEWRGWLFEPVPTYFDRLVKTYAELPDIQPFNYAISDKESERTIYYLDPEKESEVKRWGRAIASFDKEYVLKHLPEELILSMPVKCIPFDRFADKHKIETVDLFVIDVEGHERSVLSTIDLERHKPRLIILEHIHVPEHHMIEIEAVLRSHGLTVLKGYKDLVAMDPKLHRINGMKRFLE